MENRRHYRRLTFSFPIKLETMTSIGRKILNLLTKNISASGAFIPTLTSFPEGTTFLLEIEFPTKTHIFETVKNVNGCKGVLVRSTPHGSAIYFDKECQMENFKVL